MTPLLTVFHTKGTLFQGCGIFEINRVIFMKKRSRQCVIAVNRKKDDILTRHCVAHTVSSQDRRFPTAGTLAWDIFLGTLEPVCKFIPGGIFLSPAQGRTFQ